MFYIINNDNKCIGACGYIPNGEDLMNRGEYYIESEETNKVGYMYIDGTFVVTEPLPTKGTEVTDEQKLQNIRRVRDNILNCTAYIFQRQLTGSDTQKLSDIEYQEWVSYWQTLRDFPELCDINNPVWPQPPITK